MSELERIATALEELVAIERAREQRKRAPRPPRQETRTPSPQAKSKAAAILRKMGVR